MPKLIQVLVVIAFVTVTCYLSYKLLAFIIGKLTTNKLIQVESDLKHEELHSILLSLKGAKIKDYAIITPNGVDITGQLDSNRHFSFLAPENTWAISKISNPEEYTNALMLDISQEESNALETYQHSLLENLAGKSITDIQHEKDARFSIIIDDIKIDFHHFGAADKELSKDEEWLKENREIIENEVYQAIANQKITFILTLSEHSIIDLSDNDERVAYVVTSQGVKKQMFRLPSSNQS